MNRRSSKRLQWKPQECSAGQPADVGRSQGGEAEPLTVSTSAGKECFTVGSLHRPMCFVSVYKAVVKASNLEVCFSSNVILKLFSNISRAGYSPEECLQLQRKVNSCSISGLRYCSPRNILKCGPTFQLVPLVMKALVNRKFTVPDNFMGNFGTPAVSCSGASYLSTSLQFRQV